MTNAIKVLLQRQSGFATIYRPPTLERWQILILGTQILSLPRPMHVNCLDSRDIVYVYDCK
jgi:hypothetical protein